MYNYISNYKAIGGVLIIASILLSGCSTYKEEFTGCDPDKGIPCKTLPEVHKIVNEGDYNGQGKQAAPSVMMTHNPLNNEKVVLSDHSILQRVKEEHLRIWIAPFQDEQGNFHEASVVHSVIRPSFWQMQTTN